MARTELDITDPVGLHARPAAKFVKLAGTFAADVTVHHGDRSADAASLLQVLQLEAGSGAHVTIEATGDDAEEAVAALAELLTGADA